MRSNLKLEEEGIHRSLKSENSSIKGDIPWKMNDNTLKMYHKNLTSYYSKVSACVQITTPPGFDEFKQRKYLQKSCQNSSLITSSRRDKAEVESHYNSSKRSVL